MNIDVVKPAELMDTHILGWRQILLASEELSSPFFSPEYTCAVARHRDDVYVALLHDAGELVGVFPFQRGKRKTGGPVGSRLNDFQAGIFAPGVEVDIQQLLAACDLRAWHFDHLITSQSCFRGNHISISESPCIDLSMGFEAYLSNAGSRIKTNQRKGRKMSREVGPLRFEFNTEDRSVLDWLITLKSEHLRQKKLRNVLLWDWVVPFLDDIRTEQAPGCQGTLSALYAGDELVSAHFGIRSERVFHYWFATFDPKFEQYSAGAVLLLRLIQECSGRGLVRLDLGKGDELYKKSFQTGHVEIAEGALARQYWNRKLQHTAYRLRDRLRATPLRGVANAAKKYIYTH